MSLAVRCFPLNPGIVLPYVGTLLFLLGRYGCLFDPELFTEDWTVPGGMMCLTFPFSYSRGMTMKSARTGLSSVLPGLL